MCNVAYSVLAEGRNADELEELDITIGMIENPVDVALAMLHEDQKRRGVYTEDG